MNVVLCCDAHMYQIHSYPARQKQAKPQCPQALANLSNQQTYDSHQVSERYKVSLALKTVGSVFSHGAVWPGGTS